MEKVIALGFAAVLAGCVERAEPAPDLPEPAVVQSTPAQVRDLIAAEGPVEAVRRLGDESDGAPLQAVLGGIEGGDAVWIALAPDLRAGLGGEGERGLVLALSRALPINAAAVLGVISEDLPARELCRFQEDEGSDDAFRAAATASVSAVSDPELRGQRMACLRALER